MGPLLGALSGTAVGAVMVLVAASDSLTGVSGILGAVAASLVVGVVYGGTTGAVTGFFVGLPLVFLVGRHLPREVARRRAWVLGAALPPLALMVAYSLVSGEVMWIRAGLPRGDDWWGLLPFLSASALGGPLASWAVALDALPTPVS